MAAKAGFSRQPFSFIVTVCSIPFLPKTMLARRSAKRAF